MDNQALSAYREETKDIVFAELLDGEIDARQERRSVVTLDFSLLPRGIPGEKGGIVPSVVTEDGREGLTIILRACGRYVCVYANQGRDAGGIGKHFFEMTAQHMKSFGAGVAVGFDAVRKVAPEGQFPGKDPSERRVFGHMTTGVCRACEHTFLTH